MVSIPDDPGHLHLLHGPVATAKYRFDDGFWKYLLLGATEPLRHRSAHLLQNRAQVAPE